MARTTTKWLRRDYPITEFLFAVTTSAPELREEVLTRAWRAAVRARPAEDDARAVVLGEVLRTLNDMGRLHLGPTTAALPGPFLPAGDPWEGWWSDDDAVRPVPAGLERRSIVNALRELPLGHRVLLVLRDCAGLDPHRTATLVAGAGNRQDLLMSEARVGFICLIDDHVTRETSS